TDTHYYFEWGFTTGYENSSAVPPGTDAGSGVGLESVSLPLSDLSPTATYHYRIVASNADGVTLGVDKTFRTPQLADVMYSPVRELTTTSAELRGTVNPRDTGATTYHFEYGLDTSYESSTPESPPIGSDDTDYPASAEIDGLAVGTTYHYRLVATSPTGVMR